MSDMSKGVSDDRCDKDFKFRKSDMSSLSRQKVNTSDRMTSEKNLKSQTCWSLEMAGQNNKEKSITMTGHNFKQKSKKLNIVYSQKANELNIVSSRNSDELNIVSSLNSDELSIVSSRNSDELNIVSSRNSDELKIFSLQSSGKHRIVAFEKSEKLKRDSSEGSKLKPVSSEMKNLLNLLNVKTHSWMDWNNGSNTADICKSSWNVETMLVMARCRCDDTSVSDDFVSGSDTTGNKCDPKDSQVNLSNDIIAENGLDATPDCLDDGCSDSLADDKNNNSSNTRSSTADISGTCSGNCLCVWGKYTKREKCNNCKSNVRSVQSSTNIDDNSNNDNNDDKSACGADSKRQKIAISSIHILQASEDSRPSCPDFADIDDDVFDDDDDAFLSPLSDGCRSERVSGVQNLRQRFRPLAPRVQSISHLPCREGGRILDMQFRTLAQFYTEKYSFHPRINYERER